MNYNNGYCILNVDIMASGYTAIGVIGFILGSSYFAPSVMRVFENTLDIEIRNHNAPQYSGSNDAAIYILYCKN